jgi:hypothetical protein
MVCATAIAITMGTGLRAESITIQNFSFEDPTLSTDEFTPYGSNYPNQIPDWNSANGNAGVQHMSTPTDLNPNNGQYDYVSIPDGVNAVFNDSGAPITQDLSATLLAGEYTMTVDVGWRNGHGFDSSSNFGLYTSTGTFLDGITVTPPALQGAFQQESFTFDVAPTNANLGQGLMVELDGAADYDDVRLDFTAAPEPSTYALMGMGVALLAGVGFARRRAMTA